MRKPLSRRLLALLAACALLVLFLLLGECEAPEPAAEHPAPAPEPEEELPYLINAQGELCRQCVVSARRPPLAKPVSGRFTATGQLLVRQ